jgi:hypothetical protein
MTWVHLDWEKNYSMTKSHYAWYPTCLQQSHLSSLAHRARISCYCRRSILFYCCALPFLRHPTHPFAGIIWGIFYNLCSRIQCSSSIYQSSVLYLHSIKIQEFWILRIYCKKNSYKAKRQESNSFLMDPRLQLVVCCPLCCEYPSLSCGFWRKIYSGLENLLWWATSC